MDKSERNIICMHCQFNTKIESELLSHSRIHHQNEANFRIQCFRCPQVSRNLKTHEKHIKMCKRNLLSGQKIEKKIHESPFPINEAFWQCKICEELLNINIVQNFQDFQLVVRHCSKHAKEETVPSCPVCSKEYKVIEFWPPHFW